MIRYMVGDGNDQLDAGTGTDVLFVTNSSQAIALTVNVAFELLGSRKTPTVTSLNVDHGLNNPLNGSIKPVTNSGGRLLGLDQINIDLTTTGYGEHPAGVPLSLPSDGGVVVTSTSQTLSYAGGRAGVTVDLITGTATGISIKGFDRAIGTDFNDTFKG